MHRHLLVAATFCASIFAPSAWANETSLTVEITSFAHDRGAAVVHVFSQADGYPTKPERAVSQATVAISGGKATARFSLPAGSYALSIFHDEDGNGKLNSNFIGIPTEGLGASNNAKGFMGPPSFDAARISVSQATRHTVKMAY